jgi:hypothetical protein
LSPNGTPDPHGSELLFRRSDRKDVELPARYGNHSGYQIGKFVLVLSTFLTQTAEHSKTNWSFPHHNSNNALANTQGTAYFRARSEGLEMKQGQLHADWDWALLSFPQDHMSVDGGHRLSRATDQDFTRGQYKGVSPPSGKITLRTGKHGLYHGTLSPNKTSLRVQESIHDVRLIILDSFLPMGSSGTWSNFDGYLCGIIIAARQDRP